MSYQTEERYWTDYLRIALPIAGLLLLLSVFWYWASSFIGDDNGNQPRTPEAAIINTPITAVTLTPTLAEAIQITPQTIDATQAAAAAQSTQAPQNQPTETTAQGQSATEAASTGKGFVVDDLVVVNDNDVNMRSDPTISGEIVDTLSQGIELRIIDSQSVEADDFVWWYVENPAVGNNGWIAEQFLDKSG